MKNISPADKRVRVLTTAVDTEDGVKSVLYGSLEPTNDRTATIMHYKGDRGWEIHTSPGGLGSSRHKKADAVRLAAAWVADGTLPHED